MALRLATKLTFLTASISGIGCTESPLDAPPEEVVRPLPTARPKRIARAKLTELQGDVQVKRATADAWASGNDDMELYENDKVRTVAGASARVVFANGSHVTVAENALVSIAETRTRPGQDRSDLTVLEGRIDAELPDSDKNSLTVTTPAATVRAGREIVFQ